VLGKVKSLSFFERRNTPFNYRSTFSERSFLLPSLVLLPPLPAHWTFKLPPPHFFPIPIKLPRLPHGVEGSSSELVCFSFCGGEDGLRKMRLFGSGRALFLFVYSPVLRVFARSFPCPSPPPPRPFSHSAPPTSYQSMPVVLPFFFFFVCLVVLGFFF